MKAYDAVVRLGGVATSERLLQLTTRKRLRVALSRGRLVKVGRGRFAVASTDQALIAAQEANGHLSHLSAAAHWGWEIVLPPDRPQITLSRKRHLRAELSRPIEVFRRDLPSEDVHGLATGTFRTVLDCARDLPFPDALAVADSALRHGHLKLGDLVAATESLRGERGRAARLVAAYADARSANAFESALRALAIEAGLGSRVTTATALAITRSLPAGGGCCGSPGPRSSFPRRTSCAPSAS